MKQVYKCDYCNYMDTEEKVKEHEIKCIYNYDRKSCYTCKHQNGFTLEDKKYKYKCDKGIDVPAEKLIEFCNLYEKRDDSTIDSPASAFASALFSSFGSGGFGSR